MELFVFWLICAVLVGVYANSKGHSGFGMFLVAMLLSPLIGFLIEAVRQPNRGVTEQAQVASGAMKKCPACAELIRREALKCRYCGEAQRASESMKNCTTCGKLIRAEASSCGYCGDPQPADSEQDRPAAISGEQPPSGFGG